ncbi:MAG: Rne/Rng family ribonuclease [Armatimonadetes bacterium]|nr:Rne/Rng family ribonuclease [Armatimonadota bacterium]
MYKEIFISVDDLESRVAVLEDGTLMEIYIEREERQSGSIYKGRVANVLPGMQAAFVDIGLERNAFLCKDDLEAGMGEEEYDAFRNASIKDILKVGQETIVQIVKESIGTKGARVTTGITLPGRYLVLLPTASYVGVSRRIESEEERRRLKSVADSNRPEGVGLIVRTAAEGRTREELVRDLEALVKLWERIKEKGKKMRPPSLVHQELTLVYKVIRDLFTEDVDRLIVDSAQEYEKILELMEIFSPELKTRVHLHNDRRPLFELHGIDKEIDKALRRQVWLDSGAHLIIDKTEALTVIDVNTGKFIGRSNLSDTILKTNLEAVKEITHQMRLRDIGGIVIVDFIDMDRHDDKVRLMNALSEALKRDRTTTHLVGMTDLGLVQITRKRVGRDLEDTLRENCSHCKGVGTVNTYQTIRIRAEREIRRMALDPRAESVKATVHPRVAQLMVGWEGEEMQRLEKQTRRPVHLRVDREYPRDRIDLHTLHGKEAEDRLRPLRGGQESEAYIDDTFGSNLQSGLAVVDGHLVEVLHAGNMVGERVRVSITSSNRWYCQAQVKK